MGRARKIDIYLRRFGRWEYQYSTNVFSKCKDAVEDFLHTSAAAGDSVEPRNVSAHFDKSWRRW